MEHMLEQLEQMRPLRKLEDMQEIQEMRQMYPNLKTFEFQCNLMKEEWTSEPPLPSTPPGWQMMEGGGEEGEAQTWPTRHKVLERIVVFWLDPTADDPHEFWVYGGLNAMPEEGFMYYLARYVVRKEEKTISCLQEIQMLEGGWFDNHTTVLEYLRCCLPWLKDYTYVQVCRMHQATWPAGEALLAAFTEGEVLESTERFYPEDDD